MGRKTDINVSEVAQVMKKDSSYVRYGLQQGRLVFGSAVQKPNGKWSYNIVFRAFCEYMKQTEDEIRKQVKLIRKGGKLKNNRTTYSCSK